ncbi:MAG: sulfotransferase [Steroidobacteraceae bacterium]
MLEDARRRSALAPDSLEARFHEVECLQIAGETRLALECLQRIEADHAGNALFLLRAGETYARYNRPDDYQRCCRRAFELAPQDPEVRVGLAGALVAVGDAAGAEALLTGVTTERPQEGLAWLALARLRRWTAEDNHVAAIESAVAATTDRRNRAASCYALYKEYDDLGQPAKAMSWLHAGAKARRGSYSYRVEFDEAALAEIVAQYPAERLRDAADTGPGHGALFVAGLPRSGTTLVDRILSAHPLVESLGEPRDLAFAALGGGAMVTPGRSLGGSDASPDFAAIGRSYLGAVGTYRTGRPYFVDKATMNFLLCGLVRLALPGARTVVLRRHPLDSCLALYSTYFHEHLPFAHDLHELGRYYVAWHRLLEHWRQSIPGQLLVMPYESLVSDPETQIRRLLAHCGLDWDPRCLDFHLNESTVTTLSANQVRRPMYTSSVGRWKKYERELKPLIWVLRDAGIPLD